MYLHQKVKQALCQYGCEFILYFKLVKRQRTDLWRTGHKVDTCQWIKMNENWKHWQFCTLLIDLLKWSQKVPNCILASLQVPVYIGIPARAWYYFLMRRPEGVLLLEWVLTEKTWDFYGLINVANWVCQERDFCPTVDNQCQVKAEQGGNLLWFKMSSPLCHHRCHIFAYSYLVKTSDSLYPDNFICSVLLFVPINQ